MVYVDTSVLVPLFVNEAQSAAAAAWYSSEKAALVAAGWCIPEFASALGHQAAHRRNRRAARSSRLIAL